jgi:hypothetical protein
MVQSFPIWNVPSGRNRRSAISDKLKSPYNVDMVEDRRQTSMEHEQKNYDRSIQTSAFSKENLVTLLYPRSFYRSSYLCYGRTNLLNAI